MSTDRAIETRPSSGRSRAESSRTRQRIIGAERARMESSLFSFRTQSIAFRNRAAGVSSGAGVLGLEGIVW